MGYNDSAPQPLWAQYRDEFPVTRNLIYLNHAAVAPLPRRAAKAMQDMAEDGCLYGSLHYDRWMAAWDGVRSATARMINCTPGEVALVKNTSEGIATVALGLNWQAGDKVVAFKRSSRPTSTSGRSWRSGRASGWSGCHTWTRWSASKRRRAAPGCWRSASCSTSVATVPTLRPWATSAVGTMSSSLSMPFRAWARFRSTCGR